MSTPDEHLPRVLTQYAVDTGPFSPVRQVQAQLMPIIQRWAGSQLLSVGPSGSFAKGTAVRTGTDIDLFVSLSSTTTDTLARIYDTLFSAIAAAGYQPKRQNVSIGVRVNGAYDVDLVPGKRQSQFGDDHSLYSNRTQNWVQTNVTRHITEIQGSNRLDEIRLLKIWRNRRGLDFPSFYLELATIRALSGKWSGNLAANVAATLEFVRDKITTARLVDPANSNNVVSDVVNAAGKTALAAAATSALASQWQTEFV